jgi:biopolymer transport protein ExbD
MARKINRELRDEEYEFELPISMIDVVFLLLIFFMCAAKFRSVEKMLDADLPKDEGQNPVKPPPIEIPNEIRVKIYWANHKGEVIYSPQRAFPENWPGVIVKGLSIAGPHVVIKIKKTRCTDLNDLATKLSEMGRRNPDVPVVIDARSAVPFKWIIGAIDACARAKIQNVKFQAPPVPEGGGDDWWWM